MPTAWAPATVPQRPPGRPGYRVQNRSGTDLVFRPPGSVQALWALGAPPVRRLIEQLQTRVVGEVLAETEAQHLWVRVGADSLVQRERRADLHQGLLELACSLICLRRLRTSF